MVERHRAAQFSLYLLQEFGINWQQVLSMPALEGLGMPVHQRLLFAVQGQEAIHLPLHEAWQLFVAQLDRVAGGQQER